MKAFELQRRLACAGLLASGIGALALPAAAQPGLVPTDAAPPPSRRPRTAIERHNKALVLHAYDKVLGQGQFAAADRYFARDLIQHDPTVRGGLSGLIDQIRQRLATAPVQAVTVKHVIADGAYVVVHSQVSATPGNEFSGTARFDIHRIDDGLIVEQWAVSQAVPGFSANGNSMFNDVFPYPNPPEPISQAREEQNKNLAVKLLTSLFVARDVSVLDRYWSNGDYLQHNPFVPNGTAALRGFVLSLGPSAPRTRFALAEGDLAFVFTQTVDTTGDLASDFVGQAVGDLFRIVGGFVVEHWDVIAPVPATTVNGNSMFSELFVDDR